MAVNPDNVARFKDVTLFLAEDLKILRAVHDDRRFALRSTITVSRFACLTK